MGIYKVEAKKMGAESESELVQRVRLAVSQLGVRIFRNNTGVLQDKNGKYVRYGVGGNGGADLLGWCPLKITPEMVGKEVLIITAIEVKTKSGKISPEQQNFINAISSKGGIAGVSRSEEDAISLIGDYLHKMQGI